MEHVPRCVIPFLYIPTEKNGAPARQKPVVDPHPGSTKLEEPSFERLGARFAQSIPQGPERTHKYGCILDVLRIGEAATNSAK